MAQPASRSLAVPPLLSTRLSQLCKCPYRPFSTSRVTRADDSGKLDVNAIFSKYMTGKRKDDPRPAAASEPASSEEEASPDEPISAMQRYVRQARSGLSSRFGRSTLDVNHHLHVYSHRHNNHVTLTRPDGSPLLSLSAGNIGFKHAQRGSYDAAYQLANYAMTKMVEKGMIHDIEQLELVMRGFGRGREAFQKALLSTEGRRVKSLVVKVTDGTRLKFGGTRSQNVRRL